MDTQPFEATQPNEVMFTIVITDQEMEGRAIDMLVLSKGNSSTEEYVDKFLHHDSQKILLGQQVQFSFENQTILCRVLAWS